jgi:hypothetical protein
MLPLALTLLALAVPPLFAGAVTARRGTAAALDGFVLIGILGLVFLDVLPDAWAHGGPAALAAMAAGFLLPSLAERLGLQGRAVHRAGLVLGLGALLAHAVLDGVALTTSARSHVGLAAAVVLHQLPVGLSTWLGTRARAGRLAAWGVIAAMAVSTLVGFLTGGALVESAHAPLGAWMGLAAGTLLHVVAHTELPGADHDPRRAGLGAIVAAVLLVAAHGARMALGPEAQDDHGALETSLLAVAHRSALPLLAGLLVNAWSHTWGGTGRGSRAGVAPGLALTGALAGPLVAVAASLGLLVRWSRDVDEETDADAPPADASTPAAVIGAHVDLLAPGWLVGLFLAAGVAVAGLPHGDWPVAWSVAAALGLLQLPLPVLAVPPVLGCLVEAGMHPVAAAVVTYTAVGWPDGLRGRMRGTRRDVLAALRAVLLGSAIAGGAAAAMPWVARAVMPVVPAETAPGTLDTFALLVAAFLLGRSLLASGPRAFLGRMRPARSLTHEHPEHA